MLQELLKYIRIRRIESREKDAWFDLGARGMRMGPVNFYRVNDPLTGEWIFKVCRDQAGGKVAVKALKCPPGSLFAQLEGNSMLFQESQTPGMLYDVISVSQVADDGRLVRKLASELEEVPPIIRENYEVKAYEEAVGRQVPGKRLVTLCRSDDEKAMIRLFLLERAWPIAPKTPKQRLMELEAEKVEAPKRVKREIDTAQIIACPVCGVQHRLIHIEVEGAVKHALKRHEAGLELELS
ncbi:MAG: hypothetical protein QW186_08640 [Candidatus Bathyarchaeia archaeon]